MFGMPGVKFKGKAFTGLFGEDLVFKLGAGSAGHAKAWSTFADLAFEAVAGS